MALNVYVDHICLHRTKEDAKDLDPNDSESPSKHYISSVNRVEWLLSW